MTAQSAARAGMRRLRLGATQQNAVLAVLTVVVAALVLGPVVVLIRASFTPADSMPLESWAVTLANFVTLLVSSSTARLVFNTMVYALSSMALGVAVATFIAWCTERTDMPGTFAIRVFMFSWMAVPAVVVGFGWILLLNPGNGALNVLYRELFDVRGYIFTVYSFWTLVVVTAFAVVPTAYVMISGLLRNMDPQLEQASRVLGGGPAVTVTRITLPLLLPGLLSVGIYMFMAVVQTFDLPVIIGLTAGVPVLSTRVYLLSTPVNGMPNYGLAAAFGVVLLVLAIGLMWIYLRFTRSGERYRVVTGKAFRPRRINLGRWRLPIVLLVGTYFLVMSLPIWILLWVSLHTGYETPSIAGFSTMTLATFERIVDNPVVIRAIVNTIVMVLASATFVMLLSCLIGWFTVRSNHRLGRALDVLSFLPMAIPPIVLVLAVLLLYIRTPIYGTVWILVLSHSTIFLAFGTRTMASALMQIHRELGDAAMMSGASWWKSLRLVTFPLVWPQILNGWIWVLAHSARDLTVPLMLMTTSNIVVATALWNLWEFPDLTGTAALSVLLMGALLLVAVPFQVYAARRDV